MKYRAEIDGLRALAVLPVIFFHADFGFAHRGFLGVDIFFVISGFLITSIILSDLELGRFSFAKFYDRRIRRIMPALLTVFLVSLVFAYIVMLPTELEGFGKSLLASMVFCANFFFADLLGNYFSPDAHMQPLLHIWSLAVEEQFYIVFPVLLLVLARFSSRAGMVVVGLLTLLSLILCIVWGQNNQIWNFYMMPTRFWELAAGALLAMSALDKRVFSKRSLDVLSVLGLALIVYSYTALPKTGIFPGLNTLPVILGTVLILGFARKDTLVGRFLCLKPLVAIGLVSYSAYLWHQPLFVFARLNFFETGVSKSVYWGWIILTFILAALSWYVIEQPFRKNGHKRLFFSTLGFVSVIVLLSAAFIAFMPKTSGGVSELEQKTQYATGLDPACNSHFDARCMTGPDPRVLVWGDSFAIHLISALQNSQTKLPFAQYTRNGCSPTSYNVIVKREGMDWTYACRDFNKKLEATLKTMPDLKYILLVSPYNCLEKDKCQVLREGRIVEVTDQQLLDDMKTTLAKLRKDGYWPIIVGPTPPDYNSYDYVKHCTIRALYRYGNADGCALDRGKVEKSLKPRYPYLKELEKVAPIIYLTDYLCDDKKCPTTINGEPLYVDSVGHLTAVGAAELGKKTDLFKRIIDAADAFYAVHPIDKSGR